jgi:hypothetical protein
MNPHKQNPSFSSSPLFSSQTGVTDCGGETQTQTTRITPVLNPRAGITITYTIVKIIFALSPQSSAVALFGESVNTIKDKIFQLSKRGLHRIYPKSKSEIQGDTE